MIRNVFIFLGTFAVGAVIALVARAAMFKPHAGHSAHPAAPAEYSPMVSNALTPAKPADKAATKSAPVPARAKAAPADPHAGHTAAASTTASASRKPVNTRCAICGMDVDPKMPTVDYKGQAIGFGCRMWLPKFKADPDKYGPYYLRNEVIKR